MAAVLETVKPHRADDDLRDQCVRVLEKMLERAREGELESVLMIVRRFDGKWMYQYTGGKHASETVGQLEIVKQQWITDYLAGA